MNKSKAILGEQLKKSNKKHSNLYHEEVIERKVVLPYKYLGSDINEQISKKNATSHYFCHHPVFLFLISLSVVF